MRVLVVNAGSSSLKLRVLDGDDALVGQDDLPASDGRVDESAIKLALKALPMADAVGHRIVHGGASFTSATKLSPSVLRRIEGLTDLAPLHQPPALEAQAIVARALPQLPSVACFDTAFHATLPAEAATYALPEAWRVRWPLRRYGFHGLSHAYIARRTAQLLGRPIGDLRIVSCHLGAGASLCAIQGGRSVDTTMGFTPLEGLVMATRSGTVDPGLLLWLLEKGRVGRGALEKGLEHESGLLGLAGTADMQEVFSRAEERDGDAALALAVYIHRLRASIASMAVALNGLDALVFTGGVGERAPWLRARTTAGLSLLGVALDQDRNAASEHDQEIGASGAKVRTLVIAAREDLEIAREVRALLSSSPEPVR